MEKIIIYSDDKHQFISKDVGPYVGTYTPHVNQAARFDTMFDAECYASDVLKTESVTFLKVMEFLPS